MVPNFNIFQETTLGAAVKSAHDYLLQAVNGLKGVILFIAAMLWGRVEDVQELGVEIVEGRCAGENGEVCGSRLNQYLRSIYRWVERRWIRKIPALQVLDQARRGTVDGVEIIIYKGLSFPAMPLQALQERATALKSPWSRVEIGLKYDQFQRCGLLKLPEGLAPFMTDYVVLTHAFCWMATIGLGHGPIAVYVRSALRAFWRVPAGDCPAPDASVSSSDVVACAKCASRLLTRVVESSREEHGNEPAEAGELPPPPQECQLIAAPDEDELVADVAQFDWGQPEPACRDKVESKRTGTEVADAEYGTDVPERPRPESQGRITCRISTASKRIRPTLHRRILDLPVADKIVFYNRNSVPNAQAAFRHRIARRVRQYQPTDAERRALQNCADALGEFLHVSSPAYTGTLNQVREWLASRHYPLARRKNLIKSLDKDGFTAGGRLVPERIMAKSRVQAFIKNEPYLRSKFKPPRMICARDDAAKMLLGPLFQPLDDALFNSRFSVKHLADAQRPRVLTERLGTGRCLVLDYTAYESSQRVALQRDVEMRVYCKTLETPVNTRFFRACLKGLLRRTPVLWERGVVKYDGPLLRYSGEVTTSLGNTLNNIVCIAVARAVADKVDLESVDWLSYLARLPLVVEGDDSVQALPSDCRPEWIDDLLAALGRFGLEVKPEIYSDVSVAGFCGVRWNAVNGHRYSRDPLMALAKLCWTSNSGDLEMVRAMKAEALSIQCPHQPLVAGLCHSLRRNGEVRGVTLDRYDVERYNVMGLRVLPMAGASYRVALTKGQYTPPDDEDYQTWAEAFGIDVQTLKQADSCAARGDYQPLREALARLAVLM